MDIVLLALFVCVLLKCVCDVFMDYCVLSSGLCWCCCVCVRTGSKVFVRFVCDFFSAMLYDVFPECFVVACACCLMCLDAVFVNYCVMMHVGFCVFV